MGAKTGTVTAVQESPFKYLECTMRRMETRIEGEPLEELVIAQRLENSARKLVLRVDFALPANVIAQSEAIFAHESGVDELGRCHSSGPIG